MSNSNTPVLVMICLWGLIFFNFPLISIFNRPLLVYQIPLLYGYLFGVWLTIIILALIWAERNKIKPPKL
jgi:hypothetical protein